MSDGPESELEMALDRVRSLPPIVDPRDAVVEAAVRWHEARVAYIDAPVFSESAKLKAYINANHALRAAVAAYRAGEGR